MISTVGDLKRALASMNDEDELVLMVRGERMRYPSLSEKVGYDGSWGPAFLYYHGEPQDDQPLKVIVVLGQVPSTGRNEEIAQHRGNHISVAAVRAMKQLDPRPWLYTDPVSKQKTRLEAELPGLTKFRPRPGYVDDKKEYS
ncbi:hypothetical protein SEA_RASPUTIA_97 [Microbacterium phage Rasputia]|nr:hypothetical protein SEA_RASPUTIA_97 [Microbacterium phage Rasputia]